MVKVSSRSLDCSPTSETSVLPAAPSTLAIMSVSNVRSTRSSVWPQISMASREKREGTHLSGAGGGYVEE